MPKAFNGQSSRPYNKTDAHLLKSSCKVISSGAVLTDFSKKTALAALFCLADSFFLFYCLLFLLSTVCDCMLPQWRNKG